MFRLVSQVLLVIATCAPFALKVADLAHRYPLDSALMDISLTDATLLIAALILPICVLSRVGVDWRKAPEEF